MGGLLIAALYVETDGVYSGRPGVDLWDIERDARGYRGPHPVVAHPPCKRWGRYWHGGPSAKVRRMLGDDQGCFAAALWAVRTFGGVLEHPAHSHAWKWFGLPRPRLAGGWTEGHSGGSSCHVEQGHYGHPMRKATWLYAVRVNIGATALAWGPSVATKTSGDGYHSAEERAAGLGTAQCRLPRVTAKELLATPPTFAKLLVALARTSTR